MFRNSFNRLVNDLGVNGLVHCVSSSVLHFGLVDLRQFDLCDRELFWFGLGVLILSNAKEAGAPQLLRIVRFFCDLDRIYMDRTCFSLLDTLSDVLVNVPGHDWRG